MKRSAISGQCAAACGFARSRPRRGIALIDAIIGGVLLAVALGALISLTTRSLRLQTGGEKHLTASWLADELLAMVVVEGPVDYPKLHDMDGTFDFPFSDFSYELAIEDLGEAMPLRVTATVFWPGGRGQSSVQVQTYIAERGGDPNQPRAPKEPVDRVQRWYELEQQDPNN